MRLLMVLSLVCFVWAEETVSIPKDQLTEQQKAYVTAHAVAKNVTEASQIGKDVGEAMREGFSALSDGVNDFAKTDAGKYTAIIIAWKVMAKDIIAFINGPGFTLIRMAMAVFFFVLLSMIVAWSYNRTCVPRRIATKKVREGRLLKEVEFQIVNNDECSNDYYKKLFHGIGLMAAFILCLIFTCAENM